MDIQDYIVFCMELIGTIAFAASGAMVGINCRMDIFGVCVLGVVTAVGGGMTRDVILGNIPGALIRPVYDRAMLVMDSVGLGIFTAMGVMTGIRNGYLENTFLLAFLGTLTGVGGGLLRDMMAGIAPYIFVKHIYACASVVGALSCVWIYRNFGQIPAMLVSSVLVILIRFLAAYYHWNLPHMKQEG